MYTGNLRAVIQRVINSCTVPAQDRNPTSNSVETRISKIIHRNWFQVREPVPNDNSPNWDFHQQLRRNLNGRQAIARTTYSTKHPQLQPIGAQLQAETDQQQPAEQPAEQPADQPLPDTGPEVVHPRRGRWRKADAKAPKRQVRGRGGPGINGGARKTVGRAAGGGLGGPAEAQGGAEEPWRQSE